MELEKLVMEFGVTEGQNDVDVEVPMFVGYPNLYPCKLT